MDRLHRPSPSCVIALRLQKGTAMSEMLDWLVPATFVGSLLYTQNPKAVSVALSVIANYITACFRWPSPKGRAKFSVVLETRPAKKCVRIKYEGDLEGLSSVVAAIKCATRA